MWPTLCAYLGCTRAALRARFGDDFPDPGVIIVDGRARDKAERVGAYAFLHKPFDVDVLIRRVREGLADQIA